jgi:hypothetical protein
MFRSIVVLVMIVGTNLFASDTSTKACTNSEAIEADKAIDTLGSWDELYHFYKRFSQCDDGAIGEGFSDAVGKKLADDWKHFGRFLTLANTEKGFQRFVLKHLDQSIPADTLQKISANARSACPSNAHQLCVLIADASSSKAP